jgi:predicted Rdx family selenoprotein
MAIGWLCVCWFGLGEISIGLQSGWNARLCGMIVGFADMLETSLKQKRGDAFGITPREILLAAQIQALEQLLVTFCSGQLQVVQQLATTCDHLKKAATRGVILHMHAQVLGEIVDSPGQEGHLDVGAAGILVVDLERGGIGDGCFAHGI